MWQLIKDAAYENRWEIYQDGFTVFVGGTVLGLFALLIGLNLHLPSMIVGIFVVPLTNNLDFLFDKLIRPDDE